MAPDSYEVEHWNEAVDGKLGYDTMAKKLRSQGFVVKTWIMPPGSTYPDHDHSFEEVESIITGRYRFLMYGKEVIMERGDMVHLSPMACHDTSVVGDETVIFLQGRKFSSKIKINHWDESTDGSAKYNRLAKAMESKGYTNVQPLLIQPGKENINVSHSHDTVQAVVSGLCKFNMHDEEVVLVEGDIVEIPANVLHSNSIVIEPVFLVQGRK